MRSGSNTPSSLHASGSAHDMRPPSGQLGGQPPGLHHLTGSGTPGSLHGSVGSSLPSSIGGISAPMPGLDMGTAGITAASVGPNGVCLDYLACRCPRGPACALSHALPSMSLQQQHHQQQAQQQQHQAQLQQQQVHLQQQQQQHKQQQLQYHQQQQPYQQVRSHFGSGMAQRLRHQDYASD